MIIWSHAQTLKLLASYGIMHTHRVKMFEPFLVQDVKLYTHKFSQVLAMASSRMLVPASLLEAAMQGADLPG